MRNCNILKWGLSDRSRRHEKGVLRAAYICISVSHFQVRPFPTLPITLRVSKQTEFMCMMECHTMILGFWIETFTFIKDVNIHMALMK